MFHAWFEKRSYASSSEINHTTILVQEERRCGIPDEGKHKGFPLTDDNYLLSLRDLEDAEQHRQLPQARQNARRKVSGQAALAGAAVGSGSHSVNV